MDWRSTTWARLLDWSLVLSLVLTASIVVAVTLQLSGFIVIAIPSVIAAFLISAHLRARWWWVAGPLLLSAVIVVLAIMLLGQGGGREDHRFTGAIVMTTGLLFGILYVLAAAAGVWSGHVTGDWPAKPERGTEGAIRHLGTVARLDGAVWARQPPRARPLDAGVAGVFLLSLPAAFAIGLHVRSWSWIAGPPAASLAALLATVSGDELRWFLFLWPLLLVFLGLVPALLAGPGVWVGKRR